jgi:D-sedoheptulose 7-phosphate isomerase
MLEPPRTHDAALLGRVKAHFEESARLKLSALQSLAPSIVYAGCVVAEALRAGGKVLACGNGGSAADSQHFAAELVNRFERERVPLAGIALTTDTSTLTSIANDYAYEQVFAKQVRALGRQGDVLVAISTSGNSGNVIAAVQIARQLDLRIVALTGNGGGKIGPLLASDDVHICVPHKTTARIQEIHILALHCICDVIDCRMFSS